MNEKKMRCQRVLIIDDHPLLRRGMKQLLETSGNFEVIADVGTGIEGIEIAVREGPDLIILDLNMKGLSGLDTLKALRKESVDSRICILTVSDARNDIYTLIDEGADGYLLKDTDPMLLLEQLEQIVKGEMALSDEVRQALVERRAGDDLIQNLTNRELDVLSLVSQGLSNKQVANDLGISEETVKVHIRNLLRKLKVHSRLAATILYLEYQGQK